MACLDQSQNFPLCCYQGATFVQELYYVDADDNAIVITGATARMQVRRTVENEDVLIELSTEDGSIVVDGANGGITLTITASDTEDLPSGEWVYDLFVTLPSNAIMRFLAGSFEVVERVTR